MDIYRDERDRLMDLWVDAERDERIRILARIAVIDEEMEVAK